MAISILTGSGKIYSWQELAVSSFAGKQPGTFHFLKQTEGTKTEGFVRSVQSQQHCPSPALTWGRDLLCQGVATTFYLLKVVFCVLVTLKLFITLKAELHESASCD